jgi:hypothetical protein
MHVNTHWRSGRASTRNAPAETRWSSIPFHEIGRPCLWLNMLV